MSNTIFQIVKLVLIIVLLCFSAALATPKGKLPLALRGLQKLLNRKDPDAFQTVPLWKRFVAMLLAALAIVIAII